ncbi:hypothetical protein QAD02_012146 [Eretmocerus hayati]|uniref:Uncharacterized protein n=1 Tax=Eretmocerus hayati TaxID=131215 RepID=A0ACC2NYI8_9HYME|nr:hypothetical protein QAD02_012146 [Eretmocerus hayati]
MPLETIEAIISTTYDINYHGSDELTPLMAALHNRYYEVVSILLLNGADANRLDYFGRNSLHIAIQTQATLYIIESLLRCHPRSDTVSIKDNSYPLGLAIKYNDVSVADLLLAFHADINFAPDANIGPAIRWAVIYNHLEVLRLLIYYKASVNYIDHHGVGLVNTCIGNLARTNDINTVARAESMLRVLLDNGGTVPNLNLEMLLCSCTSVALRIILEISDESVVLQILENIIPPNAIECSLAQKYCIIEFVARRCFHNEITLPRNLSKELHDYYQLCVTELTASLPVTVVKFSLHQLIEGKFCYPIQQSAISALEEIIKDNSFPTYTNVIQMRLTTIVEHQTRSQMV